MPVALFVPAPALPVALAGLSEPPLKPTWLMPAGAITRTLDSAETEPVSCKVSLPVNLAVRASPTPSTATLLSLPLRVPSSSQVVWAVVRSMMRRERTLSPSLMMICWGEAE